MSQEFIDRLARKLNGAVVECNESSQLMVASIRDEIIFAAAVQASQGELTPDQIALREELDPNDLMARLYWSYISMMYAQVYARAASLLAHWPTKK